MRYLVYGLGKLTATAVLCGGMVQAFRFYYESVHGIYPWADHMAPLSMLVTAAAYWLVCHGFSLLADPEEG